MTQWYYAKGTQQAGPVSFEELQGLAAGGHLGGSDMIWTEGMANWQPASAFPELLARRASTASAAAPAPAPIQTAPAPAAQPQTAYPQGAYDPAGNAAAAVSAQSGYGPLSYASPGQGVVMVSERSLELFRQTRPWVRFISIVFLVVGAIYGVFGIIGLVGTLAVSSRGAPFVVGQMIGAGLVALVYLALGSYLGKFATKAGQLVNARRSEDLEAALDAQRSFWRLSDIVMAIGLAVVVIVLFFVVVGGVSRF